MSFLSCIGKKSKRKKASKREPIDRRLSEISQNRSEILGETSKKDGGSRRSSKSLVANVALQPESPKTNNSQSTTSEKDDLQEMAKENKMFKAQLDQQETTMKSYKEEISRLEADNIDLKTRVTKAEADAAKNAIENQKLLQKIVGMEENQAMVSRTELHNMISQLEEAESRASNKAATELSGIRTRPADVSARKKVALTQEDKQLSWKLTKTEARLSQSMDENKRLRDDLKDMLDSHTELQQIIVSETGTDTETESIPRSISAQGRLNSSGSDSESQTDDTTESELLNRLRDAETDNELLQRNYAKLEDAFVELQQRLSDLEDQEKTRVAVELAEHSKTIKAEDEQHTDNTEDVMNKLVKVEREQNAWRLENEVLEKVCESLASRIDKISHTNAEMKNTAEQLYQQTVEQGKVLDKQVKDIEQLLNDKNKANDENKRLIDENKKLNQQTQKRKDTSSKNITSVENIERELTDVKHKYEEANRRLKEYTSSKQAQPTKSLDLNTMSPASLAERFRCELYEQHWKQAFKTLTGKLRRDEKKTTQILAEICTESYLFCKRAARMQMDAVTSSLVTPTSNHYRSGQLNSKRNGVSKSLSDQLPEDLRRRLAHYRCRPTQGFINTGVHDFLNQIDYDRTRFLRHVSERDFNEIMSYITACFELSWCMAAQEPSMYLLFKVKHGVDIDPGRFDTCQSHGKRVDYIIWPAVFSEEGGACLQKGVASALPERL